MRWPLVAVPLLLPLALLAQETPRRADSEILTAGAGQTTLSPQRAVLRIGITSRAGSAAGASSRNARLMNAVVDTLVRAGFPRDSLQTVAFGVGPNYDYEKNNKLIDYEAAATIRVVVHDLSRIGSVIDQVFGAGATNIADIDYESDSLDIGRHQALAQALGRARDDARALAAAAGGSLGRLLEVSTRNTVLGSFGANGYAALSMVVRSGPTSITPRDIVVSVTVYANWEFVPPNR